MIFTNNLLPEKFRYPEAFKRIVTENPDVRFGLWYYLSVFPDNAGYWLDQAAKQYPERNLIPFAKCQSNDDVACFDGANHSGDPEIFIVHFFASSGWEDRENFRNFDEWLKAIISEY